MRRAICCSWGRGSTSYMAVAPYVLPARAMSWMSWMTMDVVTISWCLLYTGWCTTARYNLKSVKDPPQVGQHLAKILAVLVSQVKIAQQVRPADKVPSQRFLSAPLGNIRVMA